MTYISFFRNTTNYLCDDMEKCNHIKAEQLNNFKTLDAKAFQKTIAGSESLFFPKDTIVFEENQQLNKLYCIKKGACKFSTLDKTGQEHILRFLGEGDIMGKRSIISNEGAKVSATALTDTIVCSIDKSDILENIKVNTTFCNDLLNALVEDVNINEHTRIIFCVHKGMKQRLASLLIYLSEKFGQDDKGKLLIQIKREDMAAVLGTSQEYIINLLARFKALGLLGVQGRNLILSSKDELAKLI